MVDIDKEVVEQCKEHLTKHHAGSFNDPRLEIHYEDAKKVGITLDLFIVSTH